MPKILQSEFNSPLASHIPTSTQERVFPVYVYYPKLNLLWYVLFTKLKIAFLLTLLDPFADTGDSEAQATNYIHIRIQQRNGRKTLTTVQGVPAEYDLKKILKVLKKDFACNGNIVKDDEMGEVIQLQGDQRVKVSEFLIKQLSLAKKNIKIHGF